MCDISYHIHDIFDPVWWVVYVTLVSSFYPIYI